MNALGNVIFNFVSLFLMYHLTSSQLTIAAAVMAHNGKTKYLKYILL